VKKILTFFFIALLLAASPVWGESSSQPNHLVRLETSHGAIVLELYSQKAPKTVENFLSYVRDGFFNNTIFHRVIKGFMIQGGGLSEDMQKKATKEPIVNEADNGLKNRLGTVAMARTNLPHSATAQFFINTANNSFLDHKQKTSRGWGYCVFGKVVEGMDTMISIEEVTTGTKSGRQDVPITPVIIKQIVLAGSPGK